MKGDIKESEVGMWGALFGTIRESLLAVHDSAVATRELTKTAKHQAQDWRLTMELENYKDDSDLTTKLKERQKKLISERYA